MALRPEQAKALIAKVMGTRDQEVTCDECGADLAEFVEVQLTGKPLGDALQAVHGHLERSHDCPGEYHVLRQGLAALAEEEGRWSCKSQTLAVTRRRPWGERAP